MGIDGLDVSALGMLGDRDVFVGFIWFGRRVSAGAEALDRERFVCKFKWGEAATTELLLDDGNAVAF